MLTLKTYQQQALDALTAFLQRCRSQPVADAFTATLAGQERVVRYQPIFGDTPAVCLRIPTGGGKTLLAAHCIAATARTLLDTDAPVALWLTPSDTIRTQTLDALSDMRHPYRQALAQYFGDRVQVCDLDSLQTISPQDVGKAAIVIVSTIQSFNVSNTAQRNVYAFFEELAPHFDNLPPHRAQGLEKVTAADLESQPYLTEKDIGRVKYSVANWLHLQRPVVIVDEAHNNRTDRFFQTLGRVNPGCIIELTATPVAGNNVLHHVSAQELKAEQMIKLPIVLAEHPQGWRDCVADAIRTRDQLEITAQAEPDYIRPIVLIQAAPKGNEATVDAVRQYLIDEQHIPEDQIAIATGAQKELDGIDLFDRACQIRYVITVEALKEGWDCSFAYVLASLQSVNSAKDVEQLLGRVLRMPYARSRQQDALNKAYAHIIAENFAQAASTLKDRMVQNMGFERFEAAAALLPQAPLDLQGGQGRAMPPLPDFTIQLSQAPQTQHWPEDVRQAVEIRPTTQGATLVLRGDLSADTLAQAQAFVENTVPAKERERVRDQFDDFRTLRQALRAPSQLGETFTPIPQLCLNLDGHLETVERETLASLGDWNLAAQAAQLAGFNIVETVNTFEIDMQGARLKWGVVDTAQLHLDDAPSHVSRQDLVSWLDHTLRQPDVSQPQLQAYLVRMVDHLIHDRAIPITALVRARFQLGQAIEAEIKRLRQHAVAHGFQLRLSNMTVPQPSDMRHHSFRFQPGIYPARNVYRGSFEFKKHFYGTIHDLREKTEGGVQSEEFACALAIEAHPLVKFWVRNIEREPKLSFWLPTATDYFYPDFVAELTDGRILAVEYKGQPYATSDDSGEKRQVGHQWESSSGGRCLFLFAVNRDEQGRDVAGQLRDKLQ
ncbi:MAG: DEAD/DEAH box helicase [Thiomonas sp.]